MKRILYGCVASMLLGVIFCARADLNKGLIGAWTFDDGRATDGTKGSDGVLKDGAKVVDGGKTGKALNVDGVKAHVQVPHIKAYEAMKDAFTVSAWAFVRTGKDHSAIAWKGEKVGWGALYLFRIATTSNTGLTWGGCPAGVEGWFATSGALQPNKWVHLCMTADGSQFKAYVDAKPPAITDNAGGANAKGPYLTFNDKPIEFGVGRAVGGNVGNDAYLDGLIDDVFIYDRALTDAEVKELQGGDGPAVRPVDAKGKAATAWGHLKRL